MSNAAETIDTYLVSLTEWQRKNLETFRKLVHKIDPQIEEEWKWNVPIFSVNGKPLFAMSAFKDHTKYNFIRNGALLEDADSLFNNGLESKKSRGIDHRESDTIDIAKLEKLLTEAYELTKV